MTLSLIIGLILTGITLILIEIFITPGFVVGLLGSVLLVLGVAYTYKGHGNFYGNIVLISTSFFLGVALILAFRNGAWSRFALNDVIDGKANDAHKLDVKVGDVGITMSALRPAGTAIINNQKVEVHSDGEFILAKGKIEVVKKVQHRIFIKKINT